MVKASEVKKQGSEIWMPQSNAESIPGLCNLGKVTGCFGDLVLPPVKWE